MLVFWSRFTGSNRISLAIQGAHEASVFALCMLRNGTLVSGGKDRKLISWDENYQKIQTVEVRHIHRYHFAVCSMHLYAWIVAPIKQVAIIDQQFCMLLSGAWVIWPYSDCGWRTGRNGSYWHYQKLCPARQSGWGVHTHHPGKICMSNQYFLWPARVCWEDTVHNIHKQIYL